MKVFPLLFALLLFCVTVGAQSDAVKKAFGNKYADAKSVKWQAQDDGFNVSFKEDGEKMAARFAKGGEWLESTVEIDEDDLPAAVKKAIAMQYARLEIDIAQQLLRPGKEMAYQAFLDADDLTMRVVFDAKGKLLESEKMEED